MATKDSRKKAKTRQAGSASASRKAGSPKRRRVTRNPRVRKKAAGRADVWRTWMPKRVESIAFLHRTLTRLDQTRGARELGEVVERFGSVLGDANQRLQVMEYKTRTQAAEQVNELRQLILGLPAMDSLSSLPERALENIDEALERVGLIRHSRHLLALEEARRKAQRATVRRMRRAEKARAAKIAAEKGAP